MSTNETIKEGDIVMLKSGSPNMVVVKMPKNPRDPLTVEYWNVAESRIQQTTVPAYAVEKPEEQYRRLLRMEELSAAMNGPVVRVTESMMVIYFDSVEDKVKFIKDKFQNAEEEFKAKVH